MSKIKNVKAYVQVYARVWENDLDLMGNKLIKQFFKLLIVLTVNILDLNWT